MKHIKDVCEKMAKRLDITPVAPSKERFFLDRMVEKNALSGSNLTCIVARSGVGKTTLALDVVLPEAMETKRKVLIFSSEKTAEQIVSQFIMKICGINMCLVSNAFADSKKKAELSKAIAFVGGLNVCIEDFEEQDKPALSHIETAVSQGEDIGLVFIDGLYCFYPKAKNEKVDKKNQADAIAKVKALSQKINAPIVATTYMDRTDIKKAYSGKLTDNLFLKNGVDHLLVMHRAPFVYAELANSVTDLLLMNKSGENRKEGLYYDTKHRRFFKVVD